MFGFRKPDINDGIELFKNTPNAVLVDVRNKDEFEMGRIEGSVNVPLNKLSQLEKYAEKDTPVFLYCLNGARAARATKRLKRKGYTNVVNLGGVRGYKGGIDHGRG